jgi:hypothetical protein
MSTASHSEISESLPCADKIAFDTPEAAQATGTVSEWRYGGKLKAYKCKYCHLYHLSTAYTE